MATEIDLPSLLQTPISDPLPESEVNLILSSAPFIPIPYVLNLRALTSPSLKPNLIFRSGDLSHLPPTSLARLRDDCKISTIFDLRGEGERARQPSPEIDGVETIWMPTIRDLNSGDLAVGFVVDGKPIRKLPSIKIPDDFAANEGEDGYVKMYGIVLETHREVYKAIFERLKVVETSSGILVHCSAGKDRTGVLSALILALTDTPPDIITKDYALTRIGVEPFREKLQGVLLQMLGRDSVGKGFEDPGMAAFCATRGPNIIAFLEWMGEKWGAFGTSELYPGVDGYLKQELGFSSEELENIRGTLKV